MRIQALSINPIINTNPSSIVSLSPGIIREELISFIARAISDSQRRYR